MGKFSLFLSPPDIVDEDDDESALTSIPACESRVANVNDLPSSSYVVAVASCAAFLPASSVVIVVVVVVVVEENAVCPRRCHHRRIIGNVLRPLPTVTTCTIGMVVAVALIAAEIVVAIIVGEMRRQQYEAFIVICYVAMGGTGFIVFTILGSWCDVLCLYYWTKHLYYIHESIHYDDEVMITDRC